MKVLVACEFSGVVRDAFITQGHDAISCDYLETERPGPHHRGDVSVILDQGWDLMIAHPPCTYLSNSGVSWLHRQPGRWDLMEEAALFFKLLLQADIPRVAIENPVMHKYALGIIGRKHNQTFQPYQYGHPESKRTCLWLKNLPQLRPTEIIPKPSKGYWNNQTPSGQNKLGPSNDRWKIRSRFYPRVAKAMAIQWGSTVTHELTQLDLPEV